MYMNMDLWNKLSDEDKNLIQTTAKEMETRRWEVAEADEKMNMQKLADHGIQVITFSDEELQKMSDKVREEAWPTLKEDFGPKLFDQIIESLN